MFTTYYLVNLYYVSEIIEALRFDVTHESDLCTISSIFTIQVYAISNEANTNK